MHGIHKVCNTRVYERSVLAEVAARSLYELAQPGRFKYDVGLQRPGRAPAKLLQELRRELGEGRAFQASNTARVSEFATCSRGDVVLLRGADSAITAGEVWYLFEADGQPLALISEWLPLCNNKSVGSAEWEELERPVYVPMETILTPVTYTRCRPGVVRTLVPTYLREGL